MNSLSLRGGADDVAATVPRIVCSRWELGADGLSHVYKHDDAYDYYAMQLCKFDKLLANRRDYYWHFLFVVVIPNLPTQQTKPLKFTPMSNFHKVK